MVIWIILKLEKNWWLCVPNLQCKCLNAYCEWLLIFYLIHILFWKGNWSGLYRCIFIFFSLESRHIACNSNPLLGWKKMTIITNREWCYIIVEKSDGITYNNARQRSANEGGFILLYSKGVADELSNLMGEFLLKFWYLTWMEWLLSFVENWSWNQNYFGKYMHCYFPGHFKKKSLGKLSLSEFWV